MQTILAQAGATRTNLEEPGPTPGLDRMAGGLFHTRVWATPHDSDEPPNEDEPAACQPSLQPERD